MRTDYALYVVAVICFIAAVYALSLNPSAVELSVYALAVVGIVFIGLGYMARPKTIITTTSEPAPIPPKMEPVPKVETEEEKKKPVKKTTRRRTRRKKKA